LIEALTDVSWHTALGYATLVGFLVSDPQALLRTILLLHALDAIMCHVIARNNGYPRRAWTLLGLMFGIWAVAALLILSAARERGTGRTV
jgi:hypothetical protein